MQHSLNLSQIVLLKAYRLQHNQLFQTLVQNQIFPLLQNQSRHFYQHDDRLLKTVDVIVQNLYDALT